MAFGDFFDEPKFDFDKERKTFVDNLNLLKTMSVQEQTLYKKWQEFNADVYSMTQKASKFKRINNSIWTPTHKNKKEQMRQAAREEAEKWNWNQATLQLRKFYEDTLN